MSDASTSALPQPQNLRAAVNSEAMERAKKRKGSEPAYSQRTPTVLEGEQVAQPVEQAGLVREATSIGSEAPIEAAKTPAGKRKAKAEPIDWKATEVEVMSVRLPAGLKQRLAQLADEKDVKLSHIVTVALEAALSEEDETIKRKAQLMGRQLRLARESRRFVEFEAGS